MINIFLVIWILLIHFIGDFVCQTDEMAINKSSSNKWLTIHVFTYTCIFIAGTNCNFLFCFATFITHWLTDYCTSRWTSYLWKKEDRHNFFLVIGLDQFIHSVTLIVSGYYLIKL